MLQGRLHKDRMGYGCKLAPAVTPTWPSQVNQGIWGFMQVCVQINLLIVFPEKQNKDMWVPNACNYIVVNNNNNNNNMIEEAHI